MALEEPTIEFLCNHRFHTMCFIRNSATHEPGNIRCRVCNQHLIPHEVLLEAEAVNGEAAETEAIQYMWHHEPDFKEDLKKLKKQWGEYASTKTPMGKKMKELKKKVGEETADMIEILKHKVRTAKKSFRESAEYKECIRTHRAYCSAFTRFQTKWGINNWTIRQALRNVEGAKPLIPHWSWRFRRMRLYQFNVRIE